MRNSGSHVDEKRVENDRTVIRKKHSGINRPVDRNGISRKARAGIFTRRAHWLVLRRGYFHFGIYNAAAIRPSHASGNSRESDQNRKTHRTFKLHSNPPLVIACGSYCTSRAKSTADIDSVGPLFSYQIIPLFKVYVRCMQTFAYYRKPLACKRRLLLEGLRTPALLSEHDFADAAASILFFTLD